MFTNVLDFISHNSIHILITKVFLKTTIFFYFRSLYFPFHAGCKTRIKLFPKWNNVKNRRITKISLSWMSLFSLTSLSNNYRRVNSILINFATIKYLYTSEQILHSNNISRRLLLLFLYADLMWYFAIHAALAYGRFFSQLFPVQWNKQISCSP